MYITQAELIERYSEKSLIHLTDTERTGAIDATQVSARIGDACAIIDGYLSKRGDLPVATPSALLKWIAGSITYALLFEGEIPPKAQKDDEQAKKLLEQYARGTLDLVPKPVTPPDPNAPKKDESIDIVSEARRFSRKTMT